MTAPGVPLLPLMMDVSDIPIFVVGNGPSAESRLALLAEHRACRVHVFTGSPWPTAADFTALRPRLVFVADAPPEIGRAVTAWAAETGAMAHVQDDIPLCRFHLPARLRRGQLLITVSTDGAAAGFARILRDALAARLFGPEWAGRMEEISAARRTWKENGLSGSSLFAAIKKMVTERGWLGAFSAPTDG